ncbi:sulfurtransferase TusA family protein [Thermosediminibacter litoriperuensis]|uniref:TusA-related sulfurtransferase n=1 Tax=Thermosediminibacter litoriperuensis TaxID=291989 RepID=A0A5S5AEC4_9FIRM|nr:sulfurtransferase TusA family protein [Thermosediminibacter litoriperuensis]TYP48401.1 TusA-related sulfurtransferase [Thermosediminibacter litoriperuensis]
MAEYLIDSLGDMCPVPNLKVQSKIKQLRPGDQIVLLTDHSCAVTTIVDEMKRKRLKTKVEEVENGVWRVLIIMPPVNKNPGSAYA